LTRPKGFWFSGKLGGKATVFFSIIDVDTCLHMRIQYMLYFYEEQKKQRLKQETGQFESIKQIK